MFLITFIFIILSMFVCILYFCRIYRKEIGILELEGDSRNNGGISAYAIRLVHL